MDEEEIDGWYEEQKQKYLEEYTKEIEATKNSDEAEKRYENKLNKLIEKYNMQMEKVIKNKKTWK